MTYYDTRTNTERGPRRLEVKVSDGASLGAPSTGWTPELLAAVGLVPVVDTARPADTDTTTHDRSVELLDGTPTVTWTPRPWTDEELRQRGPQPLDATGVIATLNVVLGLWSLGDAANAVHVSPEALIAEAEAWAITAP